MPRVIPPDRNHNDFEQRYRTIPLLEKPESPCDFEKSIRVSAGDYDPMEATIEPDSTPDSASGISSMNS